MTRFLLIGDFKWKISKKLEKNIKKQDFDYVLCTGDLAEGGKWRTHVFKNWERLHSGETLEGILGKKKLTKLKKEETGKMNRNLSFLNNLKKKVFIVLGNWDEDVNEKDITRKRKNIFIAKTNIIKLKEIALLAHSGYTAGYDYELLIKRLKKVAAKKRKITIFLAHEPPRGIMDKVLMKKSPRYGQHLGLEYYTKYIKKHKPRVMVCGHMHEYQGKKKLGKTLVINPGAAAQNKFAILEIVNNKIKIRFFK